jgi:hypothetical protein
MAIHSPYILHLHIAPDPIAVQQITNLFANSVVLKPFDRRPQINKWFKACDPQRTCMRAPALRKCSLSLQP